MPRRAKTVGQWATVVPVSARISRSRRVCQGVLGWSSRKMPWPMMARSSSSPCSCSQPIGVKPWRRVISWNSVTDCAAWICQEMPRRRASSRLSFSSSGVQVSICAGDGHAEEAAALVLLGALDQGEGLGHRLLAGGRVPFVLDHMAVLGEPAGGAEHRRDADAHAALGQQVEPAGMRHGEIGDGGDARQQQLGQRDLARSYAPRRGRGGRSAGIRRARSCRGRACRPRR